MQRMRLSWKRVVSYCCQSIGNDNGGIGDDYDGERDIFSLVATEQKQSCGRPTTEHQNIFSQP